MRVLALLVGAALLPLASLSAHAFYDRYWRWRDCFAENGQGRCYGCDGPGNCHVYLEQAGPIWGGLALLFGTGLVVALALAVRSGRRRRALGRHADGE
jgi:hypothetical protein